MIRVVLLSLLAQLLHKIGFFCLRKSFKLASLAKAETCWSLEVYIDHDYSITHFCDRPVKHTGPHVCRCGAIYNGVKEGQNAT